MERGGSTGWTMQNGHDLIFGNAEGLPDLPIEPIMPEAASEAASAEGPAEGEEIGSIEVINWYTNNAVSDAEVVYLTDKETGRKMLEFRGTRYPKKTHWVLRVDMYENVEDTLRIVGAMAYRGDVPGDAIDITIGAFNGMDFVDADAPATKTWGEITHEMFNMIGEFAVEMRMHNPNAVVV
jgi:hypothetical protein